MYKVFLHRSVIFLLFIIIIFKQGYTAKGIYKMEQMLFANKIAEYCKNYSIKETPFCKIYYTAEDSEYIELIARIIDTYSPLLAGDFGVSKSGQAIAVIYPTEDSFKKVLKVKEAALGLYCSGVLNFLSPNVWASAEDEWGIKNSLLESGPIIHELAHYYTDKLALGKYDIWFAEGVALYYEYKYTCFEWRPELKGVGERISYIELDKNFNVMDKALAYRCAFEYVNNIVRQKGERSLAYIMLEQSKGKSFQEACAIIWEV